MQAVGARRPCRSPSNSPSPWCCPAATLLPEKLQGVTDASEAFGVARSAGAAAGSRLGRGPTGVFQGHADLRAVRTGRLGRRHRAHCRDRARHEPQPAGGGHQPTRRRRYHRADHRVESAAGRRHARHRGGRRPRDQSASAHIERLRHAEGTRAGRQADRHSDRAGVERQGRVEDAEGRDRARQDRARGRQLWQPPA